MVPQLLSRYPACSTVWTHNARTRMHCIHPPDIAATDNSITPVVSQTTRNCMFGRSETAVCATLVCKPSSRDRCGSQRPDAFPTCTQPRQQSSSLKIFIKVCDLRLPALFPCVSARAIHRWAQNHCASRTGLGQNTMNIAE